MGTHDREQEKCIPSRRQALCLGAALVTMPAGIATLTAAPAPFAAPLSPRERIARAVREIEAALAEIYPGASQNPIMHLPDPEIFASTVFPDGTFSSGRMAMVSVTANSFSALFDAGLKSRSSNDWFGRGAA
ncbi:hypothetical protein AncyloWKF20_08670 [Ancylobacter sp. WKF20]|uniref:hypothetical protein n=1 Tax=Ancylobacter sp. WKF20 TaxID=3039801 RepID=UPI0024342BE7|nr:hypothetical protein [Ancylobacter sp. WKF20]WGD31876.1 hypothetical protein AncyloWKF20_08670 [Ancylobacter sp. WKF20]